MRPIALLWTVGGRRASLAVLFGLSLPCAAAVTDAPFFTRAELLHSMTGEVELRRVYSVRLELPALDCDEGRFTCDADEVYRQAYGLTFTEERIARQADGSHVVDRVPRGQLLIAVDLEPKDEESFEDALRAEISAKSTSSFAQPRAGMAFPQGALSNRWLAWSARPVWVCLDVSGSFGADLVVGKEGKSQLSASVSSDGAERGCTAITRALAGAASDVRRTPPSILAEERTEVRFRSASALTGRTWSDRLARLPEGATLDKRALDGVGSGGIWDRSGEVWRGQEGRDGKLERKVLMPPASLDLVEVPMWVGEWSFSTTREYFGSDPRIEQAPRVSVAVAVLPVVDRLMDDLVGSRSALTVPEDAIISAVRTRFEGGASLNVDSVIEALAKRPAGVWPEQGDWLVVSCLDDGTARYGIAPFPAAARVTNPLATCAAVRRWLE